jgi:DNA-binding transcriptional LysR family regulator
MDVRRLLTFRTVARERSFSAAARALFLTQPAVSQQVAALERELGGRLLERGPKGLSLTAAGTVVLAHADAIAARLDLADRQVAELIAGQRRRLRVGAFPSALATLVPEAIARLQQVTPGVQVHVEEGGSVVLTERVADGRLHLAVAFRDAALTAPEPAGCAVDELFDEPFLVALAPDHRLAGQDAVALADLADDPWTAPSPDHLVARACQAAGFEPRFVSITRDPLAIRALVVRGIAVTLVPRLLASELGDVVVRPLVGTASRRIVYTLSPDAGRHELAAGMIDALAAAGGYLSSEALPVNAMHPRVRGRSASRRIPRG